MKGIYLIIEKSLGIVTIKKEADHTMYLINYTAIFQIIGIIFIALSIYFMISAKRFFKKQTIYNKEITQKLDDLIKSVSKQD